MDDYEHARALLSAVIAAYSARIGTSATTDEADQLRAQRLPYVRERQDLTAGHTERVAEINGTLRRLLDEVRAGEQ